MTQERRRKGTSGAERWWREIRSAMRWFLYMRCLLLMRENKSATIERQQSSTSGITSHHIIAISWANNNKPKQTASIKRTRQQGQEGQQNTTLMSYCEHCSLLLLSTFHDCIFSLYFLHVPETTISKWHWSYMKKILHRNRFYLYNNNNNNTEMHKQISRQGFSWNSKN